MSLLDEILVPLTLFIIAVFQNGTLAWVYGAYRYRPNPRAFPAGAPPRVSEESEGPSESREAAGGRGLRQPGGF